MTREKFFNMFLFYLKQIPQEEGFKAATFFSDMIDDKMEDGISEDAALKDLGAPDELAAYVLKNAYNITPEFGKYTDEPMQQPVMSIPTPTAAASKDKIYTSDSDDIKQINIRLKNLDAEVVVSKDDKIHIHYTESDHSALSINESNGLIDFSFLAGGNEGLGLKGLFGGKKKEATPVVLLEVPTKYKESLDITSDNGAVKIQGIANANIIECTTKNATIRVLDTNASCIHARTTNHRVTINNVSVEKDLSATTSNASIDVSKTIGESVACKTTGSEITLTSVDVKNMIQVSTTNAYIEIKEVSGNYIDLRTTGARISGTIVGNINDYSITSKSSGGKSNLPNIPFGVKRLSAVTSKDNINITFKEPVQ